MSSEDVIRETDRVPFLHVLLDPLDRPVAPLVSSEVCAASMETDLTISLYRVRINISKQRGQCSLIGPGHCCPMTTFTTCISLPLLRCAVDRLLQQITSATTPSLPTTYLRCHLRRTYKPRLSSSCSPISPATIPALPPPRCPLIHSCRCHCASEV